MILGFYRLFRTVCGASLFNSSWALTFWICTACSFTVATRTKRMLGLDFAQTSSARNGSESGACSWGRSRKPSKTVNVPPHHSSTEIAEPSFGNRRFLFDAASFTDCSELFSVRTCSVLAVRSPSGFVPSIQQPQPRNRYAAEQPSPPSSLLCGAL
jgi:hypothetical protein